MHGESLRERYEAHLLRAGLLDGPGLVLLAVSGGADSLALLDLMAAAAPARGLTLLVVHADHGIHPRSSEIAARVERIAKERYGTSTVLARLQLGAAATETQARDARYAFFRREQKERNARWLVTAHHADDQAETVLLRLLRGTAPAGLAGIPERGPDGLVRPLLPFRHQELVAHTTDAGLVAFEDPANTDPRHMRSWVRGTLLPLLEGRLGDAARESLLSVASHAADDLAAWDAALGILPLAAEADSGRAGVARAALAGYDSLLAGRLIRAAAHRAGIRLGPAQAARVAAFAGKAASGKTLDLGEGVVAEASFDRLLIYRRAETPDAQTLSGDAGAHAFGNFELHWRLEPAPAKLVRNGWTTWIEPGTIAVRLPAPGFRILPLGGVGHRPVARLLMERHVPRGERAGWPVVTRNGEPVWVPGVCRADAAIPEPGTSAMRLDVAAR